MRVCRTGFFQSQHYGHFGPDNSLLCGGGGGGVPVFYRMFSAYSMLVALP